jgi:hypothetical protein
MPAHGAGYGVGAICGVGAGQLGRKPTILRRRPICVVSTQTANDGRQPALAAAGGPSQRTKLRRLARSRAVAHASSQPGFTGRQRTVVGNICRSPENKVRVERDLSPKTSRTCATPSIVSMQSTIYECNPTWCRTVAASPGDLCNRRVRRYRQG